MAYGNMHWLADFFKCIVKGIPIERVDILLTVPM